MSMTTRSAYQRWLAVLLMAAMVVGLAASPAAAARGGKGNGNGKVNEQQQRASDTTDTAEAGSGDAETTDTTETAPSDTADTAEAGSGDAETTDTTDTTEPYDAATALGSLYHVVDQINARTLWKAGITGDGVDVAVIDTGVAPVPALTGADKVVAMVDLSFEADVPEATYLDTNGHGTHTTGIIAGRAPDAGIVSVKVGDNTGAVDVSQVIAGIDWVIEHRTAGDLDIRVINLSYGTDSTQDYRIDPLARAVERAWEAGIVVVAASGNDGWPTPPAA